VHGVAWCMVWLGAWCGLVHGVAWCMVWFGAWCGLVHGVAWCRVGGWEQIHWPATLARKRKWINVSPHATVFMTSLPENALNFGFNFQWQTIYIYKWSSAAVATQIDIEMETFPSKNQSSFLHYLALTGFHRSTI
jgi:hypothetical protein